MAKLPSSFRARNRTALQYREQYELLPASVKIAVRDACVLFDRDHAHPSLRFHRLDDNKKGRHLPDSFSVSPTMQHRAIFFVDGEGINVWYWIGTHAQYKIFTGSKR
jgi:hypothetical protein